MKKPSRTAKDVDDGADFIASDPKIQQEIKERAKEIAERIQQKKVENKEK